MTTLLDLGQARAAAPDDLPGLRAYLAPLVGEPFRFARVSYGDELTLHFGDLRPARSPKLKNHPYGAYVLGVRGSPWVLKAGAATFVLSSGVDPGESGSPVRKEDIEANPLLPPGGRVVSATPFAVRRPDGFGLQVRVADGGSLLVLPSPPEVGNPEGEPLPELADWELASPAGLLSAGPGLVWGFHPSVGRSDDIRT